MESPKGIQPKMPELELAKLKKGVENITNVLQQVKLAKETAEAFVITDTEALAKDPTNIELQSQILKLNDYIIKQTNNEFSLQDQIDELNQTIQANTN